MMGAIRPFAAVAMEGRRADFPAIVFSAICKLTIRSAIVQRGAEQPFDERRTFKDRCGPGSNRAVYSTLFQGEEWGATSPFLYFTDHDDP